MYFVAKNASNNDTCYWYQEDNIAPTGTEYSGESLVQLTSSDVVPANTIVGTKGTPQNTELSYAILGKFNGETAIFYVTPANAKDGQYQMCYLTKEIDGYVDPAYEGNQGSYIRYFTRWDVYDTDGDYVTSTYSRRFNLSGYDDYLVEAIYESETEGADDPEDDHIVGSGAPTITYIGDSRNQWNNDSGVDGSGNLYAVTGKPIADGDVLFHDFAISYDFYNEEIATSDYAVSGTTLRIGMLIEKLDALDVTGDGAKILDSSYYADKYKSDYNATALSNALKNNSNPYSATGHPTINSKIGNNRTDGAWGKKFDFSVIDNMNRLQWYYTFDNTKTEGEIGSTNNANFVYRATAYLIEGPNTVYLSSTPIYFTLYDSARR